MSFRRVLRQAQNRVHCRLPCWLLQGHLVIDVSLDLLELVLRLWGLTAVFLRRCLELLGLFLLFDLVCFQAIVGGACSDLLLNFL